MLNFLISALAVWRMSSLLVNEDGPIDIFARIRSIAGVKYDEYSSPYGTNFISSLLSCVWCTSIWVSGIVSLIDKPVNILAYIKRLLALSAMAIFIDEALKKR